MLTKEESNLVHDEEHWTRLMESRELNQDERDALAETMNSIFMNQHSVDCGLLSAGGVLSCVDSVMSASSRSALAVVRPPGHHAEPDTPHGFCLFNNVAIGARFVTHKNDNEAHDILFSTVSVLSVGVDNLDFTF